MKSLIIYDEKGKIWLIAHGVTDSPRELRCMKAELPGGVAVESINISDLNNPVPVFAEENPTSTDLVETVRKKVAAGESLRKVIGSLKLSDEEKWELEKRVKEE